MGDPFDELSEHEAEKLRRAEQRFREHAGEFNPHSQLTRLAEADIFQATFVAYDRAPLVTEEEPGPIALFCNTGRFREVCRLAETQWARDLDTILELLVAVESARRPGGAPAEPEAEDVLSSFAIGVADDTYVIGYPSSSSPLIVRKELLLQVLALLARAHSALGHNQTAVEAVLEQLQDLLPAAEVPAQD